MAVYLHQNTDKSSSRNVNSGFGFGRKQYTGTTHTFSSGGFFLVFKNAGNNTSQTFTTNIREYTTETAGGGGTIVLSSGGGVEVNPTGANTNALTAFTTSGGTVTLTNGMWYQFDIWVTSNSGGDVYQASTTDANGNAYLYFSLGDVLSDCQNDLVTTFAQSLSASVTATPSLSKTYTGVRTLAASITASPSIALAKVFARTLTASVTATASLVKNALFVRVLAASVTATPSIVTSILYKWTYEAKNALSWIFESRADERLWDDSVSTWDDAVARWDSQQTAFSYEPKSTTSFSYEPKNP